MLVQPFLVGLCQTLFLCMDLPGYVSCRLFSYKGCGTFRHTLLLFFKHAEAIMNYYLNTPIQYIAFYAHFSDEKLKKFLVIARNIDSGYSFE